MAENKSEILFFLKRKMTTSQRKMKPFWKTSELRLLKQILIRFLMVHDILAIVYRILMDISCRHMLQYSHALINSSLYFTYAMLQASVHLRLIKILHNSFLF